MEEGEPVTEDYTPCSRCGEVDGHNVYCLVNDAMTLEEAEGIVMASEAGVYRGSRGQLAMAILRLDCATRDEADGG